MTGWSAWWWWHKGQHGATKGEGEAGMELVVEELVVELLNDVAVVVTRMPSGVYRERQFGKYYNMSHMTAPTNTPSQSHC